MFRIGVALVLGGGVAVWWRPSVYGLLVLGLGVSVIIGPKTGGRS